MRASHGPDPLLLSLETIGTCSGSHSDTDLIFYQDQFICLFSDLGVVRVIVSNNGVIWEQRSTLEVEGWVLDHPKLFITPDGKLHVLVQGLSEGKRAATFSASSNEKSSFTQLVPLPLQGEHLSRLTWHHGTGYGCSYSDRLKLVTTEDGSAFQLLSEISPQLHAQEGMIQFLEEDHLISLVADRSRPTKSSWIGSSFPPFIDWLWSETVYGIRGANFLSIGGKTLIAAGSLTILTPYGHLSKAALFSMTLHRLEPLFILPGFSQGSPGLVFRDHSLLMTYISYADGKASVCLAKFSLVN